MWCVSSNILNGAFFTCVCVYTYIYILSYHLKHSILRCVHELLCITLCVCVCVYARCVPACSHLDPYVFFQYPTNSCWCLCFVLYSCCCFLIMWNLKNPFVMISSVVSVVVAILWECSHILMKDCSSQSQPSVVVIVSRMST